ncbi:MAG: hypothetical protein GY706_03100 [Bacteroides sp.]|nr:hypothetical protein [Bacteroides sp.]
MDAFTGNGKGGYTESPAVAYLSLIEMDAGQITALAQQKGSLEDVSSLVVLDGNHLLVLILAFR